MFARKWSRRSIWIAASVAALAVVSGTFMFRTRQTVAVTQVPFSDLLRDLDRSVVSEVVVSGDTFVTVRSVDTLVKRLRRRIEADPAHPAFLLTVWGVGYKFADD